MPRLTRRETQEVTRERLLAAAERLIAERGIEAASLRDIAESAGYSLGAVYSNFSSKDALLQAILANHMVREMQVIREVLSDASTASPGESLARLAALLRTMRENGVLSGLIVEFHMHANRNKAFREAFFESKNARLAELAEGLSALFRRDGVELPIDPLLLAQGFSALWVGFAIQGREGGGESAEQVTTLFFQALLSTGKPRKKVTTRNRR